MNNTDYNLRPIDEIDRHYVLYPLHRLSHYYISEVNDYSMYTQSPKTKRVIARPIESADRLSAIVYGTRAPNQYHQHTTCDCHSMSGGVQHRIAEDNVSQVSHTVVDHARI